MTARYPMADLVRSLAAELGVSIEYHDGDGGYATPTAVGVPRWALDGSQWGYMICLHELAHHALHRQHIEAAYAPGGDWTAIPDIVDVETDAWVWAREHLGEQLAASTKRRISASLATYIERARLAVVA